MPTDAENAVTAQNIGSINDKYATQFLQLLQQRGIQPEVIKQYTPASVGNPNPFYDYVVNYADPATGQKVSTLVGPQAMHFFTEGDQSYSPESILSRDLAQATSGNQWKEMYNKGAFGNNPGALAGMTADQQRAAERQNLLDNSFTYDTKLGANGLYGTLNPNKLGGGLAGDVVRPPATFGLPPSARPDLPAAANPQETAANQAAWLAERQRIYGPTWGTPAYTGTTAGWQQRAGIPPTFGTPPAAGARGPRQLQTQAPGLPRDTLSSPLSSSEAARSSVYGTLSSLLPKREPTMLDRLRRRSVY